jgi:hypothetical protein
VLRGRVVKRAAPDPTPLAGASVSIAGVWSVFPPPDVDPATVVEAPNLVSLYPGLYAERGKAVDGLRRRDMVLAVGQDKTLVAPAVRGDRTVRLSDKVMLNPGDVLAIDSAHPDHTEHMLINAIKALSTDDQPAWVTFEHPLALDHEPGVLCIRATPQPPGPSNLLTRDGIPGDEVAFLAALGGLSSGIVVEISGGLPAAEYQSATLYQTFSDGDGFFRLPPLSRVASVQLHSVSGGAVDLVVSPDYRRYENLVDVVFPP